MEYCLPDHVCLTYSAFGPECTQGLVHKSDRNYLEAIKCFKNAIRMDGPNSQNSSMILRDLSQMQLQVRDYAGFLESRTKYLNTDRNMQFTSAWISLALAHHLLKNFEQAAKVLQQFRQAKGGTLSPNPYELSEMHLYEAFIYQDGGMHERALDVLDEAMAKGAIRDVTGAMEMRAQLLSSLGRENEARDIYYSLLDENPENHRFHKQITELARRDVSSAGNDADGPPCTSRTGQSDERILEDIYDELIRKYPKSRSCKRIPLDFDLSRDLFKERLRDFVMPYIQKGIPSLFIELDPLYENEEKGEIIGETLLELQESAGSNGNGNEPFWIGLCLAMHYSRVGRDDEAIQTIDQVIQLASDDECRIDAYSAKSKILDTVGDYEGAAEMAEKARNLDLADRYLNCRATMAFFKALQVEQAEDLCHLFTKGGNNNFYDMQATWYEMASGLSYAGIGDFGQALKRFKKVVEHYHDFIDDQYDFFVYCTSKQTMRSYVDMIRMMDSLPSSEILASAVEAAVRVYIHLSKHPYKTEMEKLEERVANMTPEEAKNERRLVNNKLKEREKREQQRMHEEEKAASGNKNGSNNDSDLKKVDPDPKGLMLAKTDDPLGEAKAMVDNLITGAPNVLLSHLLAYRVDISRASALGAPLSLALNHVRSALRISGASHPRVHECIVDLAIRSSQRAADDTDAMNVELAVAELLSGKTAAEYHQKWKVENEASCELEVIIVAAKIDDLLASGSDKETAWTACALRLNALPSSIRRAGHEYCRSVYDELASGDNDVAPKIFREACATVFPRSNFFGSGEPTLDMLSLNE